MRFLRWYLKLTKDALFKETYKKSDNYFKTLGWRFLNIVVWYLVTVILIMVISGLWISLPESVRKDIVSAFGAGWSYVEILANKAWISVKPAFDWFSSLDWSKMANKTDGMTRWTLAILLHLIIALIVAPWAMLVLDIVRISIFKTELESKTVKIAYLVLGILAGYYVTTSSYSVSAANSAAFLFAEIIIL